MSYTHVYVNTNMFFIEILGGHRGVLADFRGGPVSPLTPLASPLVDSITVLWKNSILFHFVLFCQTQVSPPRLLEFDKTKQSETKWIFFLSGLDIIVNYAGIVLFYAFYINVWVLRPLKDINYKFRKT